MVYVMLFQKYFTLIKPNHSMKSIFYITIFCLLVVANFESRAQGCVAVRQMGGNSMCSSNSYNLSKGEFQIGAAYRYFHSWRHFVGTDEKKFRQTTQGGFNYDGTEKGNAVNIYSHAIDLNLSYAISDRIQFNLAIPYVHNERSQVLATKKGAKINIDGEQKDQVLEGIRYSVFAQGLGDIRINSTFWVFDPKTVTKGNLQIGAGIKLNTGSHTKKDVGLFLDPKTKHGNLVYDSLVMMDQAIQPGDGGVGFSIELQGFRQLYRGIYGFANGYYLFNPRESNGSYKSAAKPGLDGYNIYASPDQYFVRAGFMTSVLSSKNLTFSLAGRWEGIPAYDALGGQVAYRRPGYVVAVEPGVSYRSGKHSIGLLVPYNFIKNRIQSAADIADQNLQNSKIADASQKVHVQGDAAFADYSINLTYSYRIGKLF
jgi:hypothetical protein